MISATIRLARGAFELDVQLEFGPGVTALYGPSGSGKTTILRLLAGLEHRSRNDAIAIIAEGVPWHTASDFVPTHQRGIGYVFQQPQLFPHLNVARNLDYASQRTRGHAAPSPAQVHEWLDLAPLLGKRATELSGGEAQRVAIGRALLSGARYLLLDEPLGSIDQAARTRILPYLGRLHRELELPMIYVSHSLDEVNYLADQVYLLEAGRIKGQGSVFETSASLELNRDEGDALAAVVKCQAIAHDEEFGLAELGLGRERLFIAAPNLPATGEYRVRIPARDVSITLSRPMDTSILNVIPAFIDDFIGTDGPSATIRLGVDGQYFLARITRKSLAQLQLSKGQQVYAQIKGIALLTTNVS